MSKAKWLFLYLRLGAELPEFYLFRVWALLHFTPLSDVFVFCAETFELYKICLMNRKGVSEKSECLECSIENTLPVLIKNTACSNQELPLFPVGTVQEHMGTVVYARARLLGKDLFRSATHWEHSAFPTGTHTVPDRSAPKGTGTYSAF